MILPLRWKLQKLFAQTDTTEFCSGLTFSLSIVTVPVFYFRIIMGQSFGSYISETVTKESQWLERCFPVLSSMQYQCIAEFVKVAVHCTSSWRLLFVMFLYQITSESLRVCEEKSCLSVSRTVFAWAQRRFVLKHFKAAWPINTSFRSVFFCTYACWQMLLAFCCCSRSAWFQLRVVLEFLYLRKVQAAWPQKCMLFFWELLQWKTVEMILKFRKNVWRIICTLRC